MKINKIFMMAAVLASGMTLASCGDAFLESLPTEQLADGGTATESSINSGLAATYQILLFDSYAVIRVVVMPVTSCSSTTSRSSRQMLFIRWLVHGTSILQVLPVLTV